MTKKHYTRLANVLGHTAGLVLCDIDYQALFVKVGDILSEDNSNFQHDTWACACRAARTEALHNAGPPKVESYGRLGPNYPSPADSSAY